MLAVKPAMNMKADNAPVLVEFMFLGKLHNFSTFWFLQFIKHIE